MTTHFSNLVYHDPPFEERDVMIELPEAIVLARQINQTLGGKQIRQAIANHTPHKFAWYSGDPAEYNNLLAGKTMGTAVAFGGEVEITVNGLRLVISVPLRYHEVGKRLPAKHQLLLEFSDGTAVTGTVQMWGWLLCVREGEKIEFAEYHQGRERPSPLSDAFDQAYFDRLFANCGKLSAKAFLATEQRIPGLGNGVLQDILWTANIHPRRKLATLSTAEIEQLYHAVKTVLHAMASRGGRDTERDLLGRAGGYQTILSKNSIGTPCPACGTTIKKENYLGGSIYVCEGCQKTTGLNR
jgi:formamidopyrimidine-DNA glycosylase